MSYGTPLAITLPTIDGVAKQSAAAPLINAAFSAIKARLEQKVSPASMDINADLSFRSGANYYGATDLQRAAFASQTTGLAAGSYPATLYVLNGNLFYNDDAGNAIQVTAGGVVNASTTGGVTGVGYGSGVPLVEINWDSVNNKYKFYGTGTSPNHYAALECDDVVLRDGSGNAIRFGAPTGMSADYTCLLPSAVPAAVSVMVMDTSGNLSHSTSPASFTVAAGGHITVSGAGRYKHGSFSRIIHASAGINNDLVNIAWVAGAAGTVPKYWSFTSGGANRTVAFALHLDDGARILSVDVIANQAGVGTRTLRLVRDTTAGASVVVTSATNGGNPGWASRNYNLADSVISASSGAYYLEFEGITGDQLAGLIVNYDRP